MPEPNLLARGHAEAHPPVPPVILYQDIPEGDAAQERPGRAVVKHAQAVRAGLARVHEQIVQRPRLEPHILRHRLASGAHHTHPHCKQAIAHATSHIMLGSTSRWKMPTKKGNILQSGIARRRTSAKRSSKDGKTASSSSGSWCPMAGAPPKQMSWNCRHARGGQPGHSEHQQQPCKRRAIWQEAPDLPSESLQRCPTRQASNLPRLC